MSRHAVATPEAMLALGARVADGLPQDHGCVVYLIGDLGAGKTTLTRGVLQALGHAGRVKSPTYTLMESYLVTRDGVARQLHHLDLYRIAAAEEVEALALRDLDPRDWVLIEWPEKGEGALPPADLVAHLEYATDPAAGRVVGFDIVTPNAKFRV